MARRNDHTREQIKAMAIEAALDILRREGGAGLSTRKVAAEIGYTVGTLYLAFRNLDDLILHVNAATLDALRAAMAEAAGDCNEPRDCLMQLGYTYLRFAHQQHARWSLLFTHQLPRGEAVPEWFSAKVAAVHALVEQALRALAPQAPPAAITEAAMTLWGGVHGICVLALSDKFSLRQGTAPQQLVENLFANYLRGFLAERGCTGSDPC